MPPAGVVIAQHRHEPPPYTEEPSAKRPRRSESTRLQATDEAEEMDAVEALVHAQPCEQSHTLGATRIEPAKGDRVQVLAGDAKGHRGVLLDVADGDCIVDTEQLGIKVIPLSDLTCEAVAGAAGP